MQIHKNGVKIIGAAETETIGVIPDKSALDLHVEAAHRALEDAGLSVSDVDGLACSMLTPIEVAFELGVEPSWIDGTNVGGCSPMMHVRHAMAAISARLCSVVLIVHGQSGRSRVGAPLRSNPGADHSGQLEAPYGASSPPSQFSLPVRRFMQEFNISAEQLASVPVAQRKWASLNARAYYQELITVDDVLGSKMVADPLHLLECCLVTDAGGAIVVASKEIADQSAHRDRAVPVLGTGEAIESPMVSGMKDFTSSAAFRHSGELAFAEAGLLPSQIDHAMLYDAFAHVPLFALQDLKLVKRGEAGDFVASGETAPGGTLPVNTNGGGLSYTHPGQYGMFAIQESVRQLRGEADAQIKNLNFGIAHGNGGMFSAASTLVLGVPGSA